MIGAFLWRNKDQGENDFIVLKISALKISALGFRRDSKVDFTQNFDIAALNPRTIRIHQILMNGRSQSIKEI